jgi:tetratricopeptide (TPR) repeat protein
VCDIGDTYYNSGDYENALTYYRRSLEGYEKTVGTDHTETLNTVRCIGNTYYDSGDYENALTYYRRLLEGRKKTLGADHADTLEAAQDIRDAERYITTTESSAASQTSSI